MLRAVCSHVLPVALLLTLTARLAAAEPIEAPPEFGLQQRTLWTTSRVVGSPEPPPPYEARRAFPQLSFKRPLYLAVEPGGRRLLVVEQAGNILAIPNRGDADSREVFCHIDDHDTYSLTFHPRFAQNGLVYVFSNGPRSAKRKSNRIYRFHVSPGDAAEGKPPAVEPETRRLILEYESNGHNGGEMAFGPDGYLYISSGDGTSDSDGDDTGQNIRDLTSGVLRVDVDHPAPGCGYSVPNDNPFLHIPGARGELWAYGFRNPWRMTFDKRTGDLWVGDIGQDLWEMITRVRRGANYGWSVKEGSHPFLALRRPGPTPISPPTVEHPHSEARSITGGFVYDGQKYPDLHGVYLYGDYSTGKVWGLRYAGGQVTFRRELADTSIEILGFCQGTRGEILLVDYGGGLYELTPAPQRPFVDNFPRKLSETGVFASVKEQRPQPGLIAYSVNAPLWSDGAEKRRYIGLPGDTRIGYSPGGAWKFPEATVLVKTFALRLAADDPQSLRTIETRLLTLRQGEWVGYSYRWNDEQTDAELVSAAGADQTLEIEDGQAPNGRRRQVWRYPSRAECMVCHSRAAGFVLGVNTLQMNRQHDYGGVSDNQLRALAHIGVLNINSKKLDDTLAQAPALVDPTDETASLESRARAYLHANCAHCHVQAGGGNSAFNVSWKVQRDAMQIIGAAPRHDRFGLREALLVAPGQPDRSLILYRLEKLGAGRMPPLASSVVDQETTALLRRWIEALPAETEKKK